MTITSVKPAVVLHLLGNTGSGKSTVMNLLVARNPGLVVGESIGRLLRAKYGAAHFQGQASMPSTEEEAMSLYTDFVETSAANEKVGLIIVDGQPRNVSQVHYCGSVCPELKHAYMLMHCDHATRITRLRVRDTDASDPDKWALAAQRSTTDYRPTYEVIIELAKLNIHLDICDMTDQTIEGVVAKLEAQYV